ncbi:TraR/DksA C4-type zinc finger protein [Rhodococcus sp. BGS-1C]|jgi:RNA polymerase-binding transcription factor DksA|uniref:TraR/DksA family transcriptional regulator n=1 Tax=unclassified Rhodococcus (in: high G+C Gram-positive bacteria) TaxID=192944 RepID=UPI0019D07E54|nr:MULTISPECIES: TraR/DksA C4-type zinc finger protein [unclassified Rhodococcus (in: high G+C Gram-positive bacteria)]MCC8929594.1 TraR/DksA C4-type zinc finger protein [Rhodococcus sp. I2R]
MDECAERNRERIAEERAVVSARLESLQRQFRAIIDGSRWSTDDDEHDPEGSTIAFERATVLSLARDAEAELRELDAAAERVRTGAYGRCERCGVAIADARMEALPAARRCIACVRLR